MDRCRKILLIIDGLGKGGVERRMLELVKHMTRNTNYEVTLISLSDNVEYEDVYNLPVNFVILKRSSKKDLTVFYRLFKIIKRQAPDIIHSWSSMSNIYSFPIAKILKIKFITSVIADSPNNLNYKNKAFFRAKITFPFADKITSNSLAGLKAYKAPLEKSLCIYNGFDQNRLSVLHDERLIKQKLGVENEIIIGMVAGFEDRKDYATLITAAKAVIDLNKNVVFLLIGDGHLRKEMMQMVPGKYEKSILFLGKINNVESYINVFDIAILCTNTTLHQEGISNSIMEYMALKKPVIATEGGGTNEIVVHNSTGFLIPSHDPEALKEKIIELMEKISLRSTFGANGYQRIKEFFTIEKMCSSFYSVYDEVLNN